MTLKEKEIYRIVNNTLCYDDSADFGAVLWEVLRILTPENFIENCEPELRYIEEK